MKKKHIKPADNAANQPNANRGISGTNLQYDQAQGNRGKQKNPNRKDKPKHRLCSVTFLISEYRSGRIDLKSRYIRVVPREEAKARGLRTFIGHEMLEFTKGIKSVAHGLNHSGALQRICAATEGTGVRPHWQYWIDDQPCIDEKHPGAVFDALEYCPAIDGY